MTTGIFIISILPGKKVKADALTLCQARMVLQNFVLDDKLSIPRNGMYYLKAHIHYDKLRFYHSADGKDWKSLGPVYDYSTLSDEIEAFGGDAHLQVLLSESAVRIYREGEKQQTLTISNTVKECNSRKRRTGPLPF